jgi:quercetin dioxygenase-like cupin family protein
MLLTKAGSPAIRPGTILALRFDRRFNQGAPTMPTVEQKIFAKPDEVRIFEKGKLELVNIRGGVVGRLTLEPGWRWSTHVKPIVKTDWCEAPHFQYMVSGRLRALMEDGSEFEAGPGSVVWLPARHDGWVVGNETVVLIDWEGVTNYARPK